MINLQVFQNDGLELVVDTKTGESFGTASAIARMMTTKDKVIQAQQIISYGETLVKGLKIEPPKDAQALIGRSIQGVKIYNEKAIREFAKKYNPDLLDKFADVGIRLCLHRLAGYEVTSSAVEEPATLENVNYIKQKLEIAEAIGNALKRNVPNKSVGEQFAIRILSKAAPSEYHDIFEEAKNLIADEAATPISELYTPTDISKVLVEKGHKLYSSAIKVNQLLKDVGLQDKGTYKGAKWKATTKAKQEDLAKEVVVTVPIKTKKDSTYAPTQLKWKEAIFDYLYKELAS